MSQDNVYRRVVVEFGAQYVYLYMADQNGKVIEEDQFKQPYRQERSETSEEATETFNLLFDHLNETINFPTAGSGE